MHSRTLSKDQLNYTTIELDLLSVVDLVRGYRTMLLIFPVIFHTDHKNLIYLSDNTLRVKHLKLLLSEYRPSLQCIKGVHIVGADTFTRMRFDTNE